MTYGEPFYYHKGCMCYLVNYPLLNTCFVLDVYIILFNSHNNPENEMFSFPFFKKPVRPKEIKQLFRDSQLGSNRADT